MSERKLGLIVLSNCKEQGRLVDERIKQLRGEDPSSESYIIPIEEVRFNNGEGKIRINDSVRSKDIYILSDVGNYSCCYNMFGMQHNMGPDEHFQDIKRVVSAIGGKANRITLVMPLLYSSRQHKRKGRESLDCAMALQELESMGVSNVITFDAHDPRVQNAIPYSGFENVMPTYQVLKKLLRTLPDLKIDRDHMMVISPDEGAASRNIYYATMLGLDMGLFYKRRDYSVIVNGRNPIVAHEYMGESVEGKDVFIADDILATGDSMLDLARELKRRGAKRIFMACTFGMFTNGVEVFKKAHEEGLFDYILSTNLSYLRPELKEQPWFLEVDMSKYIALIIATLNHDRSISPFLNPLQRIQNLLAKHRAAQMGDQA